MDIGLETVDAVFLVAGAAVVTVYLLRSVRRGWDISGGGESALNLRPALELVLLPVMAFVMASLLMRYAVLPVLGLEFFTGADETKVSPTAVVLINHVAMLLGAAAICVLAKLATRQPVRSFVAGPSSIRRQIIEALLGTLAAFALCYSVFWMTTRLIAALAPGYQMPEHDTLDAFRAADAPVWLHSVIWIGTAMITPVAEEMFFRGLVQNYLVRVLRRRWLGIVAAAILFGLAHGVQPQVVPAMFVFGLILGILMVRTHGLIAPIVAHALFNSRTLLWETLKLACH